MKRFKIVCLPCICVDVFDKTDIVMPGGEALNFAAHAAKFPEMDVKLISIIGDDRYGESVKNAISGLGIDTSLVRVDKTKTTAANITYLTADGDRYYKENSWQGEILDDIILNDREVAEITSADVVFIHIWASCFEQVLELRKTHNFRLAVDFDTRHDFENLKSYAPFVDFFMVSGKEELLPQFKELAQSCKGMLNVTLAEKGSVTFFDGKEYRVLAVPVSRVVDTTGCGDSYHAGFVCSCLLDGDIIKAMQTGSRLAAKTLANYGGF